MTPNTNKPSGQVAAISRKSGDCITDRMRQRKADQVAIVDKWTNALPHCKVSAWYVHVDGKMHGQFHSEASAIGFAVERLTAQFMRSGKPLDAQTIRECVQFTNDGQGIDLHVY